MLELLSDAGAWMGTRRCLRTGPPPKRGARLTERANWAERSEIPKALSLSTSS